MLVHLVVVQAAALKVGCRAAHQAAFVRYMCLCSPCCWLRLPCATASYMLHPLPQILTEFEPCTPGETALEFHFCFLLALVRGGSLALWAPKYTLPWSSHLDGWCGTCTCNSNCLADILHEELSVYRHWTAVGVSAGSQWCANTQVSPVTLHWVPLPAQQAARWGIRAAVALLMGICPLS